MEPAEWSCGPLPNGPRGLAAGTHVIERLFVLQCVHARPKSAMPIRSQLLQTNQSLEGLFDELLALLEIVEDLPLEGEEPAIDPQVGTTDMADVPDQAVVESHGMEALAWPHAQKARELVLPAEVLEVLAQVQIGE